MDELLLNFLGREREKTVRIGERTCAMRLLSARETLSLRREIAQLTAPTKKSVRCARTRRCSKEA